MPLVTSLMLSATSITGIAFPFFEAVSKQVCIVLFDTNGRAASCMPTISFGFLIKFNPFFTD